MIASLVLAVTSAHAEPIRLAPWRALAGTTAEHLDGGKPRLQIARTPRIEHGIDEALSIAIARATHLAGKIAGLHGGIGPYVHVENLVSDVHGVDTPPRVIVIGVQLGGALPIKR